MLRAYSNRRTNAHAHVRAHTHAHTHTPLASTASAPAQYKLARARTHTHTRTRTRTRARTPGLHSERSAHPGAQQQEPAVVESVGLGIPERQRRVRSQARIGASASLILAAARWNRRCSSAGAGGAAADGMEKAGSGAGAVGPGQPGGHGAMRLEGNGAMGPWGHQQLPFPTLAGRPLVVCAELIQSRTKHVSTIQPAAHKACCCSPMLDWADGCRLPAQAQQRHRSCTHALQSCLQLPPPHWLCGSMIVEPRHCEC